MPRPILLRSSNPTVSGFEFYSFLFMHVSKHVYLFICRLSPLLLPKLQTQKELFCIYEWCLLPKSPYSYLNLFNSFCLTSVMFSFIFLTVGSILTTYLFLAYAERSIWQHWTNIQYSAYWTYSVTVSRNAKGAWPKIWI